MNKNFCIIQIGQFRRKVEIGQQTRVGTAIAQAVTGLLLDGNIPFGTFPRPVKIECIDGPMVGIEGTKTSESVAVIGATYKVEMKPLAQLIRQQSSAVINMPAVVGN